MAFESNIVSFVGNMVADPELRYTGSGVPVTSFRLASNRKWKDRSGQEQEETTFMTVSAWREMAENVAETLRKGDRTVVLGKLKQGSYEKDGVTHHTVEIDADEVGKSLRWAERKTAKPDTDSVPF